MKGTNKIMLSITSPLLQVALWMVMVCGTATNLEAQLWEKFFENPYGDQFFESVQADNSDFVLAGFTESGTPNLGFEAWVVRFDIDGDVLWDQRFGGSGNQKLYSIIKVSDGFVMVGDYNEMATDPTDIFLVKINNAGEVIWTRNYGNVGLDKASKIKTTSDGNFVLVGRTENPTTGDADMFILKPIQMAILYGCRLLTINLKLMKLLM
ncbi:MAG: hypothetical protein R2784_00510 [Saprospiraceae bacterium]